MQIFKRKRRKAFSTVWVGIGVLALAFLLPHAVLAQDGEELRQFQYAQKLTDEGLFDLAAMQCADFIAQYPSSPKLAEVRFMLGDARMSQGKYSEARAAFLAFLVNHADTPQAPQAQFRIAESLEKEGRLQEASDHFYRLYVYYPDHGQVPQALLRAAITRQRARGFAEADPLYRKLVLSHGESIEAAEAVLRLARGLANAGNDPAAMDWCQRLIDHPIQPLDKAQALALQARLAERNGRWSQAEQDYALLLKENAPDSLKQIAYLGQGRLLAAVNRVDEARQALAQASSLTGHHAADALAATAQLESAQGRPEAAQAAYQTLVKLPASARSNALALDAAAFLIGQGQGVAVQSLCEGIAADSAATADQWARALLLLARSGFHEQKYDHVIRLYDRFLAQFPDHVLASRAALKRAVILCDHLGLTEAGLAGLRDLMAQAPLDPIMDEVHAQYAQTAGRMGFRAEARRAWQWVADHAPYSPFAVQAHEALAQPFRDGAPDWVVLLETWNDQEAEGDPAKRSYLLGQRLLEDFGQPLAARRLLDQAVAMSPDAPWRDRALLLRAQTYESDVQSAVTAYHEAAQAMTDGPVRGKALARAALLDPQASMDELMTGLEGTDDAVLSGGLRVKVADLLAQGGFVQAADSLLTGVSPQAGPTVLESALALRVHTTELLNRMAESDSLMSLYFGQYPRGWHWPEMRCLLARKSDLTQRESLLREILNRAPQTAWADTARLDLGRLLNQAERYGEAETVFREALDLDRRRQAAVEAGLIPPVPSMEQALIQGLSQSLLGQGKTEPARRLMETTLDASPRQNQRLWAWSVLAGLSEQAGELDRAGWYLEQIAETAPSDTSLSALANFHFRHQRYADCRAVLEQKKERKLGDAMTADSQILTCLFREGQINPGVTRFNQFKQLYRKEDGFKACEARFQLEQGKALAAAKRFEPALEALEDAAKSKVAWVVPEAEAELGRTHLIMAHVDEALEILTALPAKYPGNPILDRVYFNLGEHYFNSKQYENSALAYRWVVDNGTDAALRPAAIRLLIRAYETIGRPDGAMAAVRTFLRDYPRDPERLAMEVKIGTLYMRLAEYDRAIEVFQRLRPLADTETEAEIQYWIGKSLAAMGRWEEAIFAFLKVNYLSGETKMPWKTTSVFEAGTAYVKLGKTAEAKRMFELVIRRDGAAGMFGKVARQRLDELEALSTEGGGNL